MTQTKGPDERDGRDDLINTLVAQALDDLENHRLDVPTALRTIACLVWVAAARGRRRPPVPGAVDPYERGRA